MATKSPGTYFSEYDNTGYSNLTTTEGTTVAIIGYAAKGPIGQPVEITTYSNFVSTFGEPISEQFSGLAVRNVLSVGGKVLFVRVADMSLASKSNVVIKNGQEATDGRLVINSIENFTVGSSGYFNEASYIGCVSNGNETKRLIVRTPSEGKLSQANFFSQLNDSLESSFGYDEFKFTRQTNGIFSFSLTGIMDEDEDKTYGPYFIKVTDSQDGEDVAILIDRAINRENYEGKKGVTNPYSKYYLVGTYGVSGATEDSSSELFTPKLAINNDIAFAADDVAINSERLNGDSITFNYAFSLDGDYKTSEVKIMANNRGYVSFGEFAEQFNQKLEEDTNGVLHVKFVEGTKKITGENTASETFSYLLFFSTETEGFSVTADYKGRNPLFYKSLMTQSSGDNYTPEAAEFWSTSNKEIADVTNDETTDEEKLKVEEFKGFIIQQIEVKPKNDMPYYLEAYFNDNTNSIIISPAKFDKTVGNSNIKAVDTYAETKVKVIPAKDGLVGAIGEKVCSIGDYIFEDEDKGIGYEIARLNGSDSINIDIRKDEKTKQIYFTEKNNIVSPSFEEFELKENEYISTRNYADLSLLTRMTTQNDGSSEVKEGTKDIVVFTAREYGSDTDNISVEVYTTVNPINEEEVTHFISVYVDGVVKQTYENVSYDMKSDRYFVKLINESVKNGGSPYITAKVVKNESGTIVSLPDSEGKSDTGFYTIGKPLNASSIMKSDNISEKGYTYYDYAIGNNGIADGNDGNELFIDAMDPEGALANQDLFSFHILITPDNINQEIQDAAVSLCEKLGDGIYIADPPQGLSKKSVIEWHNGRAFRSTPLDSNFVATYWPWLEVYDNTTSKYSWVMPSVVMAAQYVKVDKNYGPWYAPAGETNGNISAIDIQAYPNRTDRDELYTGYNRINPFVKYNDGTILAYGEKTTQRKNSTLTKVHTRRMLIQMKKEIRETLKSFIFMPSVSSNIGTMVTNVTTIMEKYKVGGGISVYNIDTSKNTVETLQQDIIYIGVNCVPVGCIEQIEVSFTLDKTSETVTAN